MTPTPAFIPSRMRSCVSALLALVAGVLIAGPVFADTSTLGTTTGDTTTTTTTTTTLDAGGEKVANEYRDFLGDDSDAVVSGLRTGDSFSVQGPTSDSGTTTTDTGGTTDPTLTDTIQPATGHMGYGEVRNTLDMAKFLLQGAGVSQPTSSDLNAVLNGGTVTAADGSTMQFQGILQLRASGMGWGRIAQQYGVKLGWVKSGRAVFDPDQATVSWTDGTTGGDTTTTSGTGGTTNLVGASSTTTRGHGIVDASGSTTLVHGNGHGHGIVDASGATSSGRGHGIVDASGATSSGRGHGIVDAMGSGSFSHGHRGMVDALGAGAGGGNGHGAGIVDALGAGSGGGNGHGAGIVDALGGSNGGGHGHVVNALGGNGNGNGALHGGGNGHGHGK